MLITDLISTMKLLDEYAKFEHNFCFTGILEPIKVGYNAHDYLSKAVNPTLLRGLTELCKVKPINPVVRNWRS